MPFKKLTKKEKTGEELEKKKPPRGMRKSTKRDF